MSRVEQSPARRRKTAAARREAVASLERAKLRLDMLDFYPRPVRIDRVRVRVVPPFFRLPKLNRYDGYALKRTILLRSPVAQTSDDLITHELCHIWQQQHERWQVLWAWATEDYEENPYELEARRAVAETRD
jgi:hypothetical protein